MVRVVHAADLHIDATYAFLTGEKLHERRNDFLGSLDNILNCCKDLHADILLISGDFYDKVNPTNEARYHALSSLKNFSNNNSTKVFIVSGNHDEPKTPGSRSPLDSLSIVNNVHVATGGHWKQFKQKCDGFSLGLYLRGYDGIHPQRNPFSNVQIGEEDVNIAIAHGSLISANAIYPNFMDYAPFTEKDCSGLNFDYYALGHLHKNQLSNSKSNIFCYPGCPQRYSFKESEGEKGVVYIDIDRKVDEDAIEFIPLPCRELINQEITLDKSMTNLEEIILEKIKGNGENKLLNIILTGEIYFDVYRNLRLSKVVSKLSENWFAIKVDREFSVYDPESDFNFNELKSVGPIEEFRNYMQEKIVDAKHEENTEFVRILNWQLEKGLEILYEFDGGSQ